MERAAAQLLTHSEPGEAGVALVRLAGDVFGARQVTLVWWEDTGPVPGAKWREDPESSLAEVAADASSLTVARDARHTCVCGDGALIVPLVVSGEPVAAVIVERISILPFGPADIARGDRLAAIAGPALYSARRLHNAENQIAHLRDIDRVKTEFLALASHELRTPITVVTGYLSLLEDGAFGPMPESYREIMPSINARLAEMEALINGMLETARVDDGRLRLEIDAWDLRELVDEAVRRCEVFVHAGQLIGLRCGDQRVPVLVDRERILTIVSNLVHNAIKYSPGHTDVHCAVTVDGGMAAVLVADNGLGIAAEDMDTLFTRFGRIRRDPAVREIAGTGLGLYLSRELARAHGGDILVRSTPGEGSTFTLVLPVAT